MKVITINGQRILVASTESKDGVVVIEKSLPISASGPVQQVDVDSYLVAEKLGQLESSEVSGNPQITSRQLSEVEDELFATSRVALERAAKNAVPNRVVRDFLSRA